VKCITSEGKMVKIALYACILQRNDSFRK